MKQTGNFLDYVPVIRTGIEWTTDEQGNVIVHRTNKGLFARMSRILLCKPMVSHLSLEQFGSFLWKQMDGKKNIYQLALELRQAYGEAAEPLYDRLVPYMQNLYQCDCVEWKKSVRKNRLRH